MHDREHPVGFVDIGRIVRPHAHALAALGKPEVNAPAVAAVVVFSPWIDLALSGPSFTSPDTHDPIFQRQVLAGAAAIRASSSCASCGPVSTCSNTSFSFLAMYPVYYWPIRCGDFPLSF